VYNLSTAALVVLLLCSNDANYIRIRFTTFSLVLLFFGLPTLKIKMFKKKKSITQANSTMVKSKITCAKNKHKTTRKELFE